MSDPLTFGHSVFVVSELLLNLLLETRAAIMALDEDADDDDAEDEDDEDVDAKAGEQTL